MCVSMHYRTFVRGSMAELNRIWEGKEKKTKEIEKKVCVGHIESQREREEGGRE